MNRKTLRDFADLHASAAMCRWQEAYADCQLRALRGDEGDPTKEDDPINVVVKAEAEIETVLTEILKEGRYTIEGRRNGTVERLQSYAMNRLRLALGIGGVIEIDHEGRTANAWSDCDVIDEGTDAEADARKPEPQSRRAALQPMFDDEKRWRIKEKGDHSYDAMTQWARRELEVDTETANELWKMRSNEFSRGAGRLKERK